VVEWGVRGGVSTWALLTGLPADGQMWSVDIELGDLPVPVSTDPRWTFILGDDLDPAVQAQLPDTADMVFIDTDHTYDQTVGELAYAATFNPARIVMHDYVMDPVRQAADEFCAREGWTVVAMEEPFGLATLVKS
jgi:predicted O-methyltransferase YrrM